MSTRGDILRRAAQVEPGAVPEPWRPSDDEDALATVSDREHYRKNLVTLPDGAGEVPAYVWDFPRTPTIPDEVREEWTRSSAGRVLNAQGQFVSRGSDVPRKSFDGEEPGLLVEAAGRTNQVTYSSDIDPSGGWGGINVSSESGVTSIIDGETAQELTQTGNGGVLQGDIGIFTGNTETVYAIIERGTCDVGKIFIRDKTDGVWVAQVQYDFRTGETNVNLGSGSNVNARTLFPKGPNGGQLVLFSYSYSGTNGNSRRVDIRWGPDDSSIVAHHAQIEEAPNASSPIVTQGSPVTRAGDDYAIFEGGQPEWWNSNEGTIFCQFSINNATIANGQEALIANGTFSSEWLLIDDRFDPFRLTIRNNANDIKVRITNHGARGLDTIKFASSALPGEVRASANGVSGKQTGDISNLLSLSDLRIGTLGRYAFAIDRIIYYPRALPESTLNRITS